MSKERFASKAWVIVRRVCLALALPALLIFAISVPFAKFWRSAPDVAVEQPPCRNCAALYASASSISTVDLCDFLTYPARYANQLVRVRAVFTNDAAQTWLSVPKTQCASGFYSVVTGLDESCEAC